MPDWALTYGDEEVVTRNEILRTVVGSGVHGIAIEGTDDHDEMGVYIPPLEHLLGVRNYRDDFVARTKPEGERSGHGDTDLVVYSLRKYLQLAVKGNPTALLPLFAPQTSVLMETHLGEELRENRGWFLSRQAVERFLGYLHAQHERMMGQGKRNRVPNRPELIEQFGWDVKYGSHALRLAYQGYEIASEGTLTLPLKLGYRERVLNVKRGEISRDEVDEEITSLAAAIRFLIDTNELAVPQRPNTNAIEEWAVDAHLHMWRMEAL